MTATAAGPLAGGYAELQVTTNYSFLRGASHPEELFVSAAALGLPALGVVDRNSVAGIVRCWEAAEATGVRLVAGCRVDLACGAAVLLYPTDRPAWSRLCRLLTLGKGRVEKGGCDLAWEDLAGHGEGLLAALVPGEVDAALAARLDRLRADFADRAYLALTHRWRPGDQVRLQRLSDLARAARVATVATGDVLHHAPERRVLQDVLTRIREGCTIDALGWRREHGDRHLKSPSEMARLFARHPDAVARTLEVVERCRFDLAELRYQYPDETERPGETAQQALERLVRAGVRWRYPDGAPEPVAQQLRHELKLIEDLAYAPYFLTVHSIVRYARSRDILCQGRECKRSILMAPLCQVEMAPCPAFVPWEAGGGGGVDEQARVRPLRGADGRAVGPAAGRGCLCAAGPVAAAGVPAAAGHEGGRGREPGVQAPWPAEQPAPARGGA